MANFDLTLCLEKSEIVRFPDVAQRTLLLLDEVSRKRELFEKEQQTGSTTSSGGSRQVHLSQSARQPHTIIYAALVIKAQHDVFRNLWASHLEYQTGSTAGSAGPNSLRPLTSLL